MGNVWDRIVKYTTEFAKSMQLSLGYEGRQHIPNAVISSQPIHKTPFCYATGSLCLVNEHRLMSSINQLYKERRNNSLYLKA